MQADILTPGTCHPPSLRYGCLTTGANVSCPRLDSDYGRAYPDAAERTSRLAKHLSIELDEPRKLDLELTNCLSGHKKGLSFVDLTDFASRVRISDVTLLACRSVITNLIEAGIHASSYCIALEGHHALRRYRLQPTTDGSIGHTRDWSLRDELAERETDLHLAGFFRAASATLDCLSAAAIGVIGLPFNIKTSALGTLTRITKEIASPNAGRAKRLNAWQLQQVRWLVEQVNDAGPSDWLSWMIDMRNTFVHRPRLTAISSATPRPMSILHASGKRFMDTQYVSVLARHPNLSDLDAIVSGKDVSSLALSESAQRTVAGVLSSVSTATAACCRRLRRVAILRDRMRISVSQPPQQWPPKNSVRTVDFSGYEPGSFSMKADALLMPREQVLRAIGSGLTDQDRARWQN